MTKKKLIEVALPLDAINKASTREKLVKVGKPTNMHLWWARRPLAAARAVILAQMVDDPSTYVEVLRSNKNLVRRANSILKARIKVWEEAKQVANLAAEKNISAPPPGPEPTLDEILAELERERLFKLIEQLVLWENTTNEDVLQQARDEIWQSWRRTCAENADHPRAKELFDRHKLPAFHDPFAGGSSLPLEAQRLGLDAYASDLNPVAVLINKAMIEIPPKFANMPPVNPEARAKPIASWQRAQGLAEDVRYYGKWMRDEAERRIGYLYPKVEITEELVNDPLNLRPDLKPYIGRKLTVIAWLWARTVKSPNPAFSHVDVPLVSTFILANKMNKSAYIKPIIYNDTIRYTVKIGKQINENAVKNGTKLTRGANFYCLLSKTPINSQYIKSEGKSGRIGMQLMAVVAESDHGRVYLPPIQDMEIIDSCIGEPSWKPIGDIPTRLTGGTCVPYGLTKWSDIFTKRQLVSLGLLSDLIQETHKLIKQDSLKIGIEKDAYELDYLGSGENAYADAVSVYLTLALSRTADWNNSLSRWENKAQVPQQLFGRQAIPMVWDFSEANPLSNSTGSFIVSIENIYRSFSKVPDTSNLVGKALQANATNQEFSLNKVVSTDPPYYDNISYADLSDFFYVWMRRSLKKIYPDLFTTLTVHKDDELIAVSYRHSSRVQAETFFMNGMTHAMCRLAEQAHPAFPITIYYAFKQSETQIDGTMSTGWETFLEAIIKAGFSLSGTWPLRTEMRTRQVAMGTNALASSIILVCRPRSKNSPSATRREFVNALKTELPVALMHLQRGNIAPVDLAQAAIGPGMAVYTRYSRVLDAEGKTLTVREALALINQVLDEVLAEQEGAFDADSRWALAWFEQNGFSEAEYGLAETLSKAKNTSVQGMQEAGIIHAKGGKVRLLKPDELAPDWDPEHDPRLTVWETVHQLLRTLEQGETAAAALAARLGARAEIARDLAYRLYTICERKKWAQEALAYNGLVQSWPEVERLAQEQKTQKRQSTLFEEE